VRTFLNDEKLSGSQAILLRNKFSDANYFLFARSPAYVVETICWLLERMDENPARIGLFFKSELANSGIYLSLPRHKSSDAAELGLS